MIKPTCTYKYDTNIKNRYKIISNNNKYKNYNNFIKLTYKYLWQIASEKVIK